MTRPAKRIAVREVSAGVTDESYLKGLGQRVRAAREARDMSRKHLAELADVSERYLAQLESGSGNASVTFLRHVADALGVRLTDLLQESRIPEREIIDRMLDSLSPVKLQQALHQMTKEFGAEDSVRKKRVALIGLRGAGKSTLGSALAKDLRRPFLELDQEIEREAGMSLSEVFMLYGQSGYRGLERRCLDRVISSQTDIVLSVGGGVVTEAETYQVLLSNCYTVWIKATPAEHMARVVAQGDMRPMKGHSQAMDDLKNLLVVREPLYARADVTISTSRQSVDKSLAALRRAVAAE